jgi:hypothetical protein
VRASADTSIVVLLVLGIGNVVIGTLLRLGVLGRDYGPWFSRYQRTELPFYLRNLAFGMIPIGSGLLASVASYYLYDAADAPAAGSVFFILGIVGILVGIVALARPPSWMKPSWLRRAEGT